MQDISRLPLFTLDAVLLSDMILDGDGDCLPKMPAVAVL